jgi:cytochrome P450
MEGLIQEKIDRMIERFKDAYREGTVIPVDAAYAALTADVISHNCYGQSFNYLEQKDYVNGLRQAVDGNASLVHLYRFFPPLMKVVAVIAACLPRRLAPRAADLFMMKRIIREKSIEALKGDVQKDSRTIFDALSDPAIPEAERSLERLEDEALLVLGAGTETTARVMSVGLFYLLSNKTLFYKLRNELKLLMPTPDARPTWNQLEQLPYLVRTYHFPLAWPTGRSPELSSDFCHQRGASTYPCYTLSPSAYSAERRSGVQWLYHSSRGILILSFFLLNSEPLSV